MPAETTPPFERIAGGRTDMNFDYPAAGNLANATDAGAKIDAKDAHGDSPLSWASWHLRPDAILRLLLYGSFRIRPQRSSMREYLQGEAG